MKNLLIILIVFTGLFLSKSNAYSQSIWTSDYESKVSDQLNEVAKTKYPNDDERKQYVAYVISHLKSELPGGIQSVSSERLISLVSTISTAYYYASHDVKSGSNGNERNSSYREGSRSSTLEYVHWSLEIEKTIRDGIMKDWPKGYLGDGRRFCDCFIKRLQLTYPNTLPMPLPDAVIQKTANYCK